MDGQWGMVYIGYLPFNHLLIYIHRCLVRNLLITYLFIYLFFLIYLFISMEEGPEYHDISENERHSLCGILHRELMYVHANQ